MSGLSVRLFGRFSLSRGDREFGGLLAGRAQELLSYVLVHRKHPLSRETIAALLWDDTSSDHPKKNLRQTLWQLHAALDGRAGGGEPPILHVDGDWVSVNPEAGIWLDVAQFETAVDAAHGVPGARLDDAQTAALAEAVDLYRGDLLEGCYLDWCLFERARLQGAYLASLDKLMARCIEDGRYEAGIDYGMRVLRIDHAHERTHRLVMRLRYLDGDRSAALEQYERCREALRDELGVEPGRVTRSLRDQIRRDDLGETNGVAPASISLETESPGDPPQLEALRALLLDVRLVAERSIDAIDRARRDRG